MMPIQQETEKSHKRIGLWAALVALVVGVGALAVAGNGGSSRTLRPLPLGATGGAANERSAAPGAAADSMLSQPVVYKAGADGHPIDGGGSAYTSCNTCVVFTWDAVANEFTRQPGSDWNPMTQNACVAKLRNWRPILRLP